MKHHKQPKSHKPSLESLTAAALILPGLLQTPVFAADDDEVDFQYSHYQEGKRDIYIDASRANDGFLSPPGTFVKAPNRLNPIEADSLFGHARISLSDRVKFAMNYTQDTWAGATPIASAPTVTYGMMALHDSKGTLVGATPWLRNQDGSGEAFMDLKGRFYDRSYDPTTGEMSPGAQSNRITHTLVSASPETRQQGDFKLNYDWNEATASVGGGLSVENDYESRFGNLGLALDFNQKRTRVNLGLSYTNSDTHATLDPMTFKFISSGAYGIDNSLPPSQASQIVGDRAYHRGHSVLTDGTLEVTTKLSDLHNPMSAMFESAVLRGNRQDWANSLGLTQVLTKNAEIDLGLGYTHSSGYLSNPYKAVYVFNISPTSTDPNQPLAVTSHTQWEARPNERNLITGNLGYHYYLEPLNAGLHAHYSVAHDDWGINAHTFDGDWVQPLGRGWTITPHARYYSQSAADFYAPYFTEVQVMDQSGYINSPYNKVLPNYHSSDHRLSGFGALSGGITVTKQFAKGISLQTGFEYYTHQGSLKLGGGGEQAFADYDFWSANAALKLNLGALSFSAGRDAASHSGHHQAELAPAGMMFNHALNQAGDMMLGYRYMRNEQAGGMRNGINPAYLSNSEVSTPVSIDDGQLQACPGSNSGCLMTPKYMVMNMHMLELMVAPTDWMTLMLMPQWTDMGMSMTHLAAPKHSTHSGALGEDSIHNHQNGGIGDTGLYALFKLFDQPHQQLVLSIGGTAPTGDNAVMRRRNSIRMQAEIPRDYGMQLGSGSWDVKPSLTYSGALNEYAWGVQATGTHRLNHRNDMGYVLGDIFQSSVWGGYHWTDWLSSTVRGVYTWQDSVHGEFKSITSPDTGEGSSIKTYINSVPASTTDFTSNYGGRFVDLGLGVNVTIPSGTFAGNTLKFEWLQPLHTDYNGYQLDRDGALTATWGVGF